MFSSASRRYASILPLLIVLAATGLSAGEKGNEGDERRPVEKGPDGLPKFRHPYTDGLYSTVTAMNTFPDLTVEKQKKVKLKVPGFRKEVIVYSTMQNHKAPLVVVLLGLDGKVDGPYGGLFPYWYNEYNYHVLTFDSSFTPAYPEVNGQGVVGNFDAEADQAAAIIDAFLKTDDAKRNVDGVGVIGMSFGASQAMLLAAKAKEGKLPFTLKGCLAISPPVKWHTSAQILDRFFAEDRWDTTMIDLAKKFAPHVPVAEGQKIPFSATEMRAAVGFVFRDGLAKVVERNDRYYKLKILPSEESGENRGSHAEVTGLDVKCVPTPGQVDRLLEALGEYGILLFRSADLTPRQHIDFSRHFGPLEAPKRLARDAAASMAAAPPSRGGTPTGPHTGTAAEQ